MAARDPRKSFYTFLSGIKGSGKSEYAFAEFDWYPFDRMVLDVTHDLAPLFTERGIPHQKIQTPIPGSWPEWMRDQESENGRLTLVFQPDMGDTAAARADLDRCVGLCLRGGPPTLLWCDELAAMGDENHVEPNLNRVLYHGRHDNISCLFCGPRAKKIPPLCIGQCDKAVTFRVLNRYDRQAICANLGLDQADFDRENKSLAEFEHQVWHRSTEEIEIMMKLPKWRRGRRPPIEVIAA